MEESEPEVAIKEVINKIENKKLGDGVCECKRDSFGEGVSK